METLIQNNENREIVFAVQNGKKVYKWICQSRKDVYNAIDKTLENNLTGGISVNDNSKSTIAILEELQVWCNDNSVDMNEVSFSYAINIYEKLGHFDFSIENSRFKKQSN